MAGRPAMDFESDELTSKIIEAVIRVHQTLGPGFMESVYQRALLIELRKRCLEVQSEKEVLVVYEGQSVGIHRLDIVVEDEVILELKTVDELAKAHYAQVRSYLKASGIRTALLVNFAKEKADFRRIENA
jgi:GxxExxY protein